MNDRNFKWADLSHNIPRNICEYIDQACPNVECIATGGGFDFPYRKFDDGRQAIVCDVEDAGAPDDIDSNCLLIVYDPNEEDEWRDQINIPYGTARAALDALNNMISIKI